MKKIKIGLFLVLLNTSWKLNSCPGKFSYEKMMDIGKKFDTEFEKLQKEHEADFDPVFQKMEEFAETITCSCRLGYKSNTQHCKERVDYVRGLIAQGCLKKRDEERGHYA